MEAILVTHRIAEPVTRLAEGDCVKLAARPRGNPGVCGTHEYTLGKPEFARTVEPGNLVLINYLQRCEELRAHDPPTRPSIEREQRIIETGFR